MIVARQARCNAARGSDCRARRTVRFGRSGSAPSSISTSVGRSTSFPRPMIPAVLNAVVSPDPRHACQLSGRSRAAAMITCRSRQGCNPHGAPGRERRRRPGRAASRQTAARPRREVAALTDIATVQGGTFLTGGRVTSPTTFGNAADQAVYSGSGGAQTLVITTEVPEPATMTVLLVGLVAAAAARRRGQRQRIIDRR